MSRTFDQSRSSCFGSQERLSDAVSEFSGQIKTLHPEKFLNQIDTYFDNLPLSPSQQLISAQRRLTGDARIWFESLIPTPESYSEFCILFRQRFWSSATQRKARNDVFRPWRYDKPDGLATHAMQWIASAKYVSPPIDQFDLVSTIIQHYPTPLGMALRGRGPRNTNELLAILTEFEESASFCDNRRDDNRPRQQYHNNHGDQNRGPQIRRDNQNQGNQRFPYRTDQQPNPAVRPVNQIDTSEN
jgi:hypothetical protein